MGEHLGFDPSQHVEYELTNPFSLDTQKPGLVAVKFIQNSSEVDEFFTISSTAPIIHHIIPVRVDASAEYHIDDEFVGMYSMDGVKPTTHVVHQARVPALAMTNVFASGVCLASPSLQGQPVFVDETRDPPAQTSMRIWREGISLIVIANAENRAIQGFDVTMASDVPVNIKCDLAPDQLERLHRIKPRCIITANDDAMVRIFTVEDKVLEITNGIFVLHDSFRVEDTRLNNGEWYGETGRHYRFMSDIEASAFEWELGLETGKKILVGGLYVASPGFYDADRIMKQALQDGKRTDEQLRAVVNPYIRFGTAFK